MASAEMNAARQNDLETVSLEENVPLIEGGDAGRENVGKQAVVGNNILESNKSVVQRYVFEFVEVVAWCWSSWVPVRI